MLHLAAVLFQTAAGATPFDWAAAHIHLIGWPALLAVAVKATWHFTKWLTDTKTTLNKTVTQIDAMAVNHFPHMEESLSGQDKTLASIDASLKTLVQLQSKS